MLNTSKNGNDCVTVRTLRTVQTNCTGSLMDNGQYNEPRIAQYIVEPYSACGKSGGDLQTPLNFVTCPKIYLTTIWYVI